MVHTWLPERRLATLSWSIVMLGWDNTAPDMLLLTLQISRAPTVVLAFLLQHHHLPLSQALDLVLKARPFVKPNQGFLDQLKDLEQE